MSKPNFRGINPETIEYNKQKARAIHNMSWYNKNVHENYLEKQASLGRGLRYMSESINKELNDKARQEEDLRQHPWREENCPENVKNCIKGALTWAFPTKSNTISYDSTKKNNGGKKSRKSHNSKKYKKSKKSHTTYKKSKRSRR